MAVIGRVITHPIVGFMFPRLVATWPLMVACAEAFAVLAQAAYFARLGVRRALALSLAANATSVLIGFASRRLLGFP